MGWMDGRNGFFSFFNSHQTKVYSCVLLPSIPIIKKAERGLAAIKEGIFGRAGKRLLIWGGLGNYLEDVSSPRWFLPFWCIF